MIRNYTVSKVDFKKRERKWAPPRTNRFPIALWCFLSRGRLCFLVNQPQQILWGLATPWAGACSGRNVGSQRGEAVSWWVSCWQVSGPWESLDGGIPLLREQPEQQEQCWDLLVVTPRSQPEQCRLPAVGYVTTCPRLSALCHLLPWFTSGARHSIVLKASSLWGRINLLHRRLKHKNNEKGKPAKQSPLGTSRVPSSWLFADSSSKGKMCFNYQYDPLCVQFLIHLQRCAYLRQCLPTSSSSGIT